MQFLQNYNNFPNHGRSLSCLTFHICVLISSTAQTNATKVGSDHTTQVEWVCVWGQASVWIIGWVKGCVTGCFWGWLRLWHILNELVARFVERLAKRFVERMDERLGVWVRDLVSEWERGWMEGLDFVLDWVRDFVLFERVKVTFFNPEFWKSLKRVFGMDH